MRNRVLLHTAANHVIAVYSLYLQALAHNQCKQKQRISGVLQKITSYRVKHKNESLILAVTLAPTVQPQQKGMHNITTPVGGGDSLFAKLEWLQVSLDTIAHRADIVGSQNHYQNH